ncbi:hypothetical protein AGMMS49546_22610 [Spirochaetia bacterium]|nr:hypothetical protein AGMMS49546_22610 [Spirochaetia bacterium]
MKKRVVIAAGLAAAVLAACTLEMPESVRIKGNPGLYIPLGSPFVDKNGDIDPDKSIGRFLGPEEIKKNMAGDELFELDESGSDILTYVSLFSLLSKEIDAGKTNLPGTLVGLNQTITEQLTTDLSSITDFGMKFKKVTGFIYAQNLGPSATLTLSEKGNPLVTNAPISSETTPDISAPGLSSLPPQSLDKEIDLTDLFNSGAAVTLDYTFTFLPSQISPGTTITIDMIIKLPLEFLVDTEPGDLMPEGYQKADYALLDFKDAFGDLGDGEGDLFGRKGNDDDMLKDIRDVTIEFNEKVNEVLPEKFLMVLDAGSKAYGANFADPIPKISINKVPNPFYIKKLEILLERPSGGGAALFPIKKEHGREHRFDFKLAMSAQAGIDYTLGDK